MTYPSGSISTRWTRFLGIAIVALGAFLAWKATPNAPPTDPTDRAGDLRGRGPRDDAGGNSSGQAHAQDAGFPDAEAGASGAEGVFQDAGRWLPSTLPDRSPRMVRLGIVLVAYAGAEGAPTTTRSKREARDLAEGLRIEARTDFHSAVQRGDRGSSDDVGRLPRGVLEAGAELPGRLLRAGHNDVEHLRTVRHHQHLHHAGHLAGIAVGLHKPDGKRCGGQILESRIVHFAQ